MPENKDIKKMKHVVDFCEKVMTGEHENHEDCWCCPDVEKYENGNKLIIHNEVN